VRDLRDPDGPFVAPAIGAGATLASLAGFGLVSFVLGIDAPVSALLPFLPEDPRRRRRRAYTTGGLSPITRL